MTETYEDLKLRERFVRSLAAVDRVEPLTALNTAAAVTCTEMIYPAIGDAPTGFVAAVGGYGAEFRVTVERIDKDDDKRNSRTASGK